MEGETAVGTCPGAGRRAVNVRAAPGSGRYQHLLPKQTTTAEKGNALKNVKKPASAQLVRRSSTVIPYLDLCSQAFLRFKCNFYSYILIDYKNA